MKISIIGPGIMPIPPTGWGAVEILIWDYTETLRKKGHEVQIVNTPNHEEIIKLVNEFKPDFVHLQYDDHIDVMSKINCPKKAATSHFGYLDQPHLHHGYAGIFQKFVSSGVNIFCLSPTIVETYKNHGVKPEKLFLTPNGARNDQFAYKEIPSYPERSICVGKIEPRKRQYKFQNIKELYFAGNCIDNRFNIHSPFYMGAWEKEELYANLTNYANLVLISDGEAHPLVCVEALMAGLGLVISELAAANLDLSKDFITVIPEDKVNDSKFVAQAIKDNRDVSVAKRSEIREYAMSTFDYDVIVDNYLKLIESI